MGLALPKLDKPGDILSLLADPEKYKQYAERLIYLRDEATTKLGELSTKESVEQYVRDRQNEGNKELAAAKLDRQHAANLLKDAARDREIAAEQLKVAGQVKNAMDSERQQLDQSRDAFRNSQQEFNAQASQQQAQVKQRQDALEAWERRTALRAEWLRQFAASTAEKLKEIPPP